MHTMNFTHMALTRIIIAIAFMLCCIVQSAAAFQSTPLDSATLTGDWKIDYTQSYDKIGASEKAELDKLSQTHLDQLRSNHEGMTYQFDSNGTFTKSLASGASVSGSWQLNNTGTLLELNYSTGAVQAYQVLGSTSTTLHLKLTGQYADSIIFKELHLIKQ